MKEIADKIERPVKSNRAWREEAEFHFANYEAMQQQLQQHEESSKIIFDAYESLRQQLAECQAQTPLAWVTESAVEKQILNGKPRRVWWENNNGVGIPIYSAPSDSTALDAMLKQAKREALLEAAAEIDTHVGYHVPIRELRRMAKELE
jgi:cephalosporin hydroxylase